MPIGISILGSGSKGNSILIHNDNGAVMIDAGFSRKELLRRLNALKLDHIKISALILSHEHSDHSKGAKVFSESLNLPVFATSSTAKILSAKKQLPPLLTLFESGAEFNISGFNIKTFLVPHDAMETVGFIISVCGIKIAVATDLGYVTALCEQRMKGASAIILESNHDVKMQMNSDRNPMLKRRVLGRNGHLSNDSAAEALAKIVTTETKNIFLVHLSRDCNDFEIVKKTAMQKLADIGRQDILLQIATEEPLPTVYI